MSGLTYKARHVCSLLLHGGAGRPTAMERGQAAASEGAQAPPAMGGQDGVGVGASDGRQACPCLADDGERWLLGLLAIVGAME